MLDDVAEEVKALVGECYKRAKELLQEHRWRLESLAERVLDKETPEAQEIYQAAGIEHPGDRAEQNWPGGG